MIRHKFPLDMIIEALSIFKQKTITKYRDADNMSLLYHAIYKTDYPLVKAIFSIFSA